MLLEQAARLYDKYEAGRPKPFNIFSVLRRESDEVNLHSRFLHALLDYKRPGHARENLADFLRHVGVENFEQRGVEVKREHDNIDILITNDAEPRQAVVIENKIWSGDQSEQLQRYHGVLMRQGYDSDEIKLLYLTPYGDAPSKNSIGKLDCTPISYKFDLPPWLERCQKRAYDEPGLRESIAQYRQLIRKLTGTDFEGAYMSEVTELVLEGGNLVLVHDLDEAMIEAQVRLWQKMWCEIDVALNEAIVDLPCINPNFEGEPHASEEEVRLILTKKRGHNRCGRFYSFGDGRVALAVQASIWWDRLQFGVYCCRNKHQGLHDQLRHVTENVQKFRRQQSCHMPWYRRTDDTLNLKKPTRDVLKLLVSETRRQACATGIAQDLQSVWEAIRNSGLAGQNP